MINILKIAYYYKSQIQDIYKQIILDSKYKFYFNSSYWRYEFEINEDNNWNTIEFVSVDSKDNIIGYLGADIVRDIMKISSLKIINFKEKGNVTFSKDLNQFLHELFTVHNFNKINFGVVCGNPIEKMYDKYCFKYGGRIVGVYKEDTKLTDGKIYDYKMYEIFQDDYLKCKGVTKHDS